MPAAIAIPLAIAGGTAAAGIYGANKSSSAATTAAADQSDAAVKAAQIQADAANKAAQLQATTAQQALDYSRSQSQLALDQYNQQQTRLQPYRNLGAFALGQAPSNAPAPLSLPPLSSSSTAPLSGSMPSGLASGTADPASYALSLVTGGMTPAQAAQQTNQKFNLQTGAQAVYYPDSNTIGLPNAYLAGPTGKSDSPAQWGIVQRSGGGGSATTAQPPSAGPVKLNYTPTQIGSLAPTSATAGTLQAPPIVAPSRSLGQIGGIY
jgi:hypothetical protein